VGTDEIHVHPIQQWVDALFADARRVRLVEENRVVLVLEESDIPALHGLLRFCG
jgi:hypothetical protein